MKNFYNCLDAAEYQLMGYEQYREIKATAVGLITCSGAWFRDSDYDMDFTVDRVDALEYGPYTELVQSVAVSLVERRERNYEALDIQIDVSAESPSARTNLLSRRLGITASGSMVKYARLKTVQPVHYGLISEAQPTKDLDYDTRGQFEEWEHEIRKTSPACRYAAATVLKELQLFGSDG